MLKTSKRKPDSFKSDRVKELYNIIFQNFLNKIKIKHYSRKTDLGAVFAERFDKIIRSFLKEPVFEKDDGNWIDILPTITKQYKNSIHSSTKTNTNRSFF